MQKILFILLFSFITNTDIVVSIQERQEIY